MKAPLLPGTWPPAPWLPLLSALLAACAAAPPLPEAWPRPPLPEPTFVYGRDDGDPAPRAIQEILDWNARELARCLFTANRTAEGVFSLALALSPDGSVLVARIGAPGHLERFRSCAVAKLQQLRFPASGDDAIRRVTTVLQAAGGRFELFDAHVRAIAFPDPSFLSFSKEHETGGDPVSDADAAALDPGIAAARSCGLPAHTGIAFVAVGIEQGGSISNLKVDVPPDATSARDCLVAAFAKLRLPAAKRPRALRLLLVDDRGGLRLARARSWTQAADASTGIGGLSKKEIGHVISAHGPEIVACYKAYLHKDPRGEGKVVLRFSIGGVGGVQSIDTIEHTLPTDELAACVRDSVARWGFPAPGEGGTVVVTYPWVFRVR